MFFYYKLYINGESVYSGRMEKRFMVLEQSLIVSNRELDEKNMQVIGQVYKLIETESSEVIPYVLTVKEIDSSLKIFTKYIRKLNSTLDGNIYKSFQKNPEFISNDNKENITNLITELHSNTFKDALNKMGQFLNLKCSKIGIDTLCLLNLTRLKITYDIKSDWTSEFFHNFPLEGISIMLAKIENDFKCASSEVISEIATRQINSHGCGFDPKIATVLPKAIMIPVGDKYEADIFLSKNKNFYYKNIDGITVDGKPIKIESGIGKFEQIVTDGNHKIQGSIMKKTLTVQLNYTCSI